MVFLNYARPAKGVEALLAAHIEWLDRYFGAGFFIAAGRKDPRTGGMLLVRDMEREEPDARSVCRRGAV